MIEAPKAVGWILLIGSFACLLPFLLLCLYWHPVGTHGADWISNWGGTFDDVSWWEQQRVWYTTTMGRFTSTALLSTVATWYSLPVARAVVFGLHIALIGAIYGVIRTVLRTRNAAVVSTSVVVALYLSQLANPYDSLYRLTGLFIYQTGLIGTLVLAGFLWRGKLIASLPVILLTAGTNEISLLHTGLLLSAYFFFNPDKLVKPIGLTVVLVAALGAAAALCAPGNWVRAELYQAGGYSLPTTVGLVVASGTYLLVTWCSSSVLLPVLALGTLSLPRVTLTSRQRIVAVTVALFLPILSVGPVLLATRGESLPEGITDWQIIPVVLLLGMVAASYPRPTAPKSLSLILAVYIGGSALLGGLGIDRRRDQSFASPSERIIVRSPPGEAWKQLLTGRSKAYDVSVRRQYQQIRECVNRRCQVSGLIYPTNNYLYDASYDRRIRFGGDDRFGSLVNRVGITVVSERSVKEK